MSFEHTLKLSSGVCGVMKSRLLRKISQKTSAQEAVAGCVTELMCCWRRSELPGHQLSAMHFVYFLQKQNSEQDAH